MFVLHMVSRNSKICDSKERQLIVYAVCVHSELVITEKQSLYKPGQTRSVPGGGGFQISRKSAQEYGKLVSPLHRPPVYPRKYS
jgi:hypothetical protein